MQAKIFLLATFGTLAGLALASTSQAQETRSSRMVATADAGPGKVRHYRKRRPLQVNIYTNRRRIGGYSYGTFDVINTHGVYGTSPPPWAHVRQTPSGPFDSGFFFDSGISDIGVGSRGADSPYLR